MEISLAEIFAYLVTTFVLTVGSVLIKKYVPLWFTPKQLEIMNIFASQAVVFVRKSYGDADGEVQFQRATELVNDMLVKKGINLDFDMIKAGVQRAYKEAQTLGVLEPLD